MSSEELSSEEEMEEIISNILSEQRYPYVIVKSIEKFVKDGNLQNVDKIINTHNGKINVNTELVIAAAKLGKVEFLEGVISKVPDLNLNAVGDYNKTALFTAAGHGHAKCVKALLLAGAGVNFATEEDYTALMAAALKGQLECLKVLLQEREISLDCNSSKEATALIMAARNGHHDCVEALLRARADANMKDVCGDTAVHVSIDKGYHHCLEALILAGADVNATNEEGITPLGSAVYNEDEKCTDMLIKAGANVNVTDKDDQTALMTAVQSNRPDIVELLAKAGADVNISTDDQEDDIIISSYDDDNNDDGDANHRRRQHKKIYGNTALTFAIQHGFKECALALIKAGADANVYKAIGGETPLICSATINHTDSLKIVKALIQAGGDVNVTDDDGFTALKLASRIGANECVELLLDAGANVNVKVAENGGNIELFRAVLWGQYRYVQKLIQAGADVNGTTNFGETPIMAASIISNQIKMDNDKYKILKMLLSKGAHVNIKEQNANALTKHLLAHSPRSKRISELLYAAGEIIGTTVPTDKIQKYLPHSETKLNLKNSCREAIRKQLLNVNSNLNLFGRVPQLGLPYILEEYMLYNISLDVDVDETESDNCQSDDDN